MGKILKTHKVFFMLLLALVTLLVGLILCQSPQKEAEGKTYTITCYYQAFYLTDDDTSAYGKTGTFKSADGNTYSGNIGSIKGSFSGSGGSWSKTQGDQTDTVTNTLATYYSYKVTHNNIFGSTSWSASASFTYTPVSGFHYTINKTSSSSHSASGKISAYSGEGSESWNGTAYFIPNTYTITFSANGGRFSDGTQSKTTTTRYYNNYVITSSTPTRTGYTFGGWYYGSTRIYSSTCYNYAGNRTLSAKWDPISYTVNFNGNGNTGGSTSSQSFTYGTGQYLRSNGFTRTNYEFTGWNTNAYGTGTSYSNGQWVSNLTTTNGGSITLYAQWKQVVFNCYFDNNKGSGSTTPTGGTSSIRVTLNQTYPTVPSVPKRDGYDFKGFYTSTSGGSQVYNTGGSSSTTVTKNYDHYLYAQWTAKTIGVTLDKQSGSGGSSSFYYRFDTNSYYSNSGLTSSLSSITIPTRTGYTFGGYYTGTNGAGTQYVSSSGAFTNTPYKKIYSNTTLYAKWTQNDYTIAFNANGGSGTMASVSGILYTSNQTLPSNTFTRTGYLFKGWATSAVAVDGSVVYKENATVSKLSSTDGAIVTLYAVWEKTWAVDKTTPSGSGTSASPYLIANAKNLAWLAWQCETQNLSGYFKQTANISLNGEIWLPIGDGTYKFLGNYDGNNYVITNITTTTITKADGYYLYSYQGLFGYANNATIDNVKVLSGRVRGYNYVGGITGRADATTITKSQVGSLNVGGDSAYNGGIVGYASSSTLTANYSKAQMTGGSYYGGIMGYSASSTFTACAFEGTLSSTSYGYSMGYGSSTATKLNDCFAKTSTSNGFIRGSKTTNSCLYIAGSAKRYYSGNFTNWVITTTNMPLPSQISWLATGGTKVTSLTQITALGYTQA